MADLHIRTSADLCHIPPGFDPSSWDIGRSTIGPVSIYTSWLPCAGYYESLVTGPDALLAALGYPAERTNTRESARDMHASLVAKVRQLVVDDSACA